MRVYWQEDPDNDKWITSLEFALQGQKHHRWETISNGVSGIGVMGELRQAWLESSWFSEVEQYQLELTEISLLPKKAVEVTYDYRTGKCTSLPSYVTLKEATPVSYTHLPAPVPAQWALSLPPKQRPAID